jgi:predicted DNA-binding transcriptional regulator YafY
MKSNRMFSILNLLMNNQKLTAQDLAKKLEVSKRTIYRDIESLNMAGVPVVSYPGQGGGLGILDGYKLDKSFFSIDELQAIVIGLDALNSIGEKKNINTLITKILQEDKQTILENADIVIDLSSWFLDNSFQDYIIHLRKAINELTLVMIEYQSNTGYSKRVVEPYKLIFKYSSWYLYAFCLEKKQFRLFKLKRILSYSILNESFISRNYQIEDSVLFFENNYFKESENKPLFEVILEYDKENQSFLIDKIGVQKFQFDSSNHKISFKTHDKKWAIDFIISLKDKVKLIEPNFLVKDIRNTIKKMNILYES